MKRTLLAMALCAATGCLWAQDDTLEPVIVERGNPARIIEHCTPPNAAPRCAAFHQLIRQTFTEREIGMLFGAATPYPEYRTSYDWTRARYQALLQHVADNGMPVDRYQHW